MKNSFTLKLNVRFQSSFSLFLIFNWLEFKSFKLINYFSLISLNTPHSKYLPNFALNYIQHFNQSFYRSPEKLLMILNIYAQINQKCWGNPRGFSQANESGLSCGLFSTTAASIWLACNLAVQVKKLRSRFDSENHQQSSWFMFQHNRCIHILTN